MSEHVEPPRAAAPSVPRSAAPSDAGQGEARIHDTGHRAYTGRRTSPIAAQKAAFVQTVRRILGLRRPARTKIVPWLTIAVAYVQAVGIVAVAATSGLFDRLEPGDYANSVLAANVLLLLFASMASAEALCPDRRDGLVTYYLVSQLDRRTYALAKTAAVIASMLLVTVAPASIELLGVTALGRGPETFSEFVKTVAQVLAAGMVVSVPLATLTLALSSLVERVGSAVALSLGVLLGLTTIGGIFLEAPGYEEGALLSPFVTVLESVRRTFGSPESLDSGLSGVPGVVVGAAWLAWTVGSTALLAARMSRLEVNR